MSRSFLPQRPSDYRMPVFMNEVPADAVEQADEMAARHGQEEARSAGKPAAKAPAKAPAAPAKAPAAPAEASKPDGEAP